MGAGTIGLILLLAVVWAHPASAQSSVAAAQNARPVDVQRLAEADKLINEAIASGKCPGAVLMVGRGDDVLYRKAYGNRVLEPAKAPMTVDVIFDLASLTKPIATATSVILLAEHGKLDVHDRVAKYLPDFGQSGKETITIEQLLLHRGGLIPDDDISDYDRGPTEAWKKICALKPESPPGTHFAYSDVGYIVLGKLVQQVSGRPLNDFAREEIFEPLGMSQTRFRPPPDWRDRCAPTELRNGRWMIGEVHDPRAYALGGIAGHAGLFGTADDLSRFCRMILHGGRLAGKRIFKETTFRRMTEPHRLPNGSGCRSYVFDIDTTYSGCRGERFQPGTTFGHTGFTGTMFWIDPDNECYLIFLTNSVHPNGKGNVLALRHDVATVVAEALLGKRTPGDPIQCGIDVLERRRFEPLAGKRLAVVTNQTGLDAAGNRTVDVLAAAKDLRLVEILSPEHGLYGLADEKISDAIDPKTGLKVYSLYGATEKPTPQMLKDIDAIVYDIQDVGARFYTYTTTLGLCMEAAAERKIPLFVLDRPNPITGLIVDGPLADENDLGFTAFAPIPVSHGMTLGELARLFNHERHIDCDLAVVPMQDWRRWMWWDDTGRMWVNPSPNMRNPNQALLYPGIGLLEACNVSVGRGTDQPFEMFGAPWIDGRMVARALNSADLPGLRFVPIVFTPASSKFAGKQCQGCFIELIDRTAVEPVRSGLTIAWMLKHLFGETFQIESVNKLLRNSQTMKLLMSADDPRKLPDSWQKPLRDFEQVRQEYLIYR